MKRSCAITNTILYYTIPYHTIPYHTIPYCTVLYYTILYYNIPYYITLYYTIPSVWLQGAVFKTSLADPRSVEDEARSETVIWCQM